MPSWVFSMPYPICLISISLNLLLLGLGMFVIVRKGGRPFLLRQLKLLTQADLPTSVESPFYQHRVSQLERLSLSSLDVVFLGDSLTNEAEWSELFNLPIKNRGISGETTEGLLKRLNHVLEHHPRKIFLMIGINDLLRGSEVVTLLQNYREILMRCHNRSPKSRVYVQSILPIAHSLNRKDMNQVILAVNLQLSYLVRSFSYEYVDLFTHFLSEARELDRRYSVDGLHLNGEGYQHWRQLIEQYVVS